MALELETERNPNLATFTLREAVAPSRSKDCTTHRDSWSDHRQEGPPAYQTLQTRSKWQRGMRSSKANDKL